MARLQQHGLDLVDRRGATIHNVRDSYYRCKIIVSEGQESRMPIAARINTQCRDETRTVFPLHLALALASPRFVIVSTGFTPAHPLWGVFLTGGKPRRQRYATLYQSEGRVWLINGANNKKVAALRAELLQSLGPGWRVGLSTGTQQEQCPPCDLRPRSEMELSLQCAFLTLNPRCQAALYLAHLVLHPYNSASRRPVWQRARMHR